MMAPKSAAATAAAMVGIVLGASVIAYGAPSPTQSLKTVHVVIPLNSINDLVYFGGRDAGFFRNHGINLTVDARPFAAFLAGLPSKQSMVGTYSGLAAIRKINAGIPWAIIGPGLNVINGIIVRKDSPFKTAADLRGKRLGVNSTSSGSVLAVRAAVLDAEKFDITKDTKMEQIAAPALYKLLKDGSVDGMINISSFTMKALAQPSKFRTLFSPNDYWIKKTGYPLDWAAPIVAWKSWVQQDPARARNFVEAVEESFRWLRNPHNLDSDVKKYGKRTGITAPVQVATYKKLFAAKKVFLTHWNRKIADAQWKFIDLAKSEGLLKKVPPEAENALLVGK